MVSTPSGLRSTSLFRKRSTLNPWAVEISLAMTPPGRASLGHPPPAGRDGASGSTSVLSQQAALLPPPFRRHLGAERLQHLGAVRHGLRPFGGDRRQAL